MPDEPKEGSNSQAPSTEPPRLLPNGVKAHKLTLEDSRKGGLANAEKLRLERQSALEIQRDWVERQGEILLAAHAKAIERGDWRAAESVLNRQLGMPTQRVERDERIVFAELAALPKETIQAMIAETRERIARSKPPKALGDPLEDIDIEGE